MRHGPRIIIKDDRDSGIGRGCVLYAGHFRPEMATVLYWAAQTAPEDIDEIVVSEGWRGIRASRDLHQELRAFDLSLNVVGGGLTARRLAGEAWAERLRVKLGPDYDVIVHGSGPNLHIHIELDP